MKKFKKTKLVIVCNGDIGVATFTPIFITPVVKGLKGVSYGKA